MARPGYRDRYRADHDSAGLQSIPNINSISRLEGDGEFVFTYGHPQLGTSYVLEVRVVPQEYSRYPSEHFFLVFACNQDIPSTISKTLEDFMTLSSGLRVQEALRVLSQNITTSIVDEGRTGSVIDEDNDTVMTDMEDEGFGSNEDDEEFENFDFGDEDASHDDAIFGLGNDNKHSTSMAGVKTDPEVLRRIRRDFRAVRKAGFKVGRICGFDEQNENHIVSISVRVDKLCLSDETREAWNLRPEEFIVLLIKYSGDYANFDEVIDRAAGASNLDFCLRKSTKYKPTVRQATSAFVSGKDKDSENPANAASQIVDDDEDLNLLAIGKSIDTFMRSDFVSMLKLRWTKGLTWDSAKRELVRLERSMDSAPQNNIDVPMLQNANGADEKSNEAKLPAFLAKEYLVQHTEISLPVVAAQFAMRFFVRCTDYCMVCHQKVEGNFEALKPYVCGDSLCLFQYMAMGFGPSIDLEVINHPNVVDLLISFCYAGLQKVLFHSQGNPAAPAPTNAFREFPTGLNLQVPRIVPQGYPVAAERFEKAEQIANAMLLDPISVQFDWSCSTVKLTYANDADRLRAGMWVVVVAKPLGKGPSPSLDVLHHGRIEAICGRKVDLHIASSHTLPPSGRTMDDLPATGDGTSQCHMVLYDQNLDDLTSHGKAFAMALLLSATPPVASMRTHITENRNRQLDRWSQLVPSAAKLLRWIVASNRSFIVQVDDLSTDDDTGLARPNERISGVDGWLQFRFAQGSPEKEVRFQEELKTVQKPQKTILAWHGSDVCNWHSIIRQGLDFKVVANGRAYGDGVYFGRDFATSLGYSGLRGMGNPNGANILPLTIWPNSSLKITSALSLNEIVNKPHEFKTNVQFCYVVQHVHWIQCRYLFVKPDPSIASTLMGSMSKGTSNIMSSEFEQDPQHIATGPSGTKLCVPRVAIPSAQEHTVEKPLSSLKRHAMGHSGDSDDEDADDISFLLSDDEAPEGDTRKRLRLDTSTASDIIELSIVQTDKTDFRPGTLDLTSLPQLAPPSYATSQAQKTIGQEIKKLQKIQASTPLHELGWYIDFENMTNMFHWIAELHSFDGSLPLAQDMKKAAVTSIVLEIRFGRDFPMSPPFVRVIRPRFLPFMHGGGGHVTAGGAMCMELLTTSGWTPVNSLESVLLQVRMAMCSLEPHPARLESTNQAHRADYTIGEAFDAYTRAATGHGWVVPKDLQEAVTAMMARVPNETK
ncbi:uncharacterized protein JN550_007202 [Neoarthrinium moseri]|uniref:uncharacterized protein n=1 Tax=Neoarthrinium moseri TaxID=1658444 RepID=UPI001FDC2AA8|nr:uncharacterized protein JN550_007202 [Neoarthrinium moseri]KAI1867150.1 hypothetical protein JN550_007202 [Neoarthrinium moseri]